MCAASCAYEFILTNLQKKRTDSDTTHQGEESPGSRVRSVSSDQTKNSKPNTHTPPRACTNYDPLPVGNRSPSAFVGLSGVMCLYTCAQRKTCEWASHTQGALPSGPV